MSERVFAMPDLGEGLEEGEVTAWLVAQGDEVGLNQPLVEVDTAKATVEIPSPLAGRVVTLHAAVGDAVPVGAPLVTFEVADGAGGVGGGGATADPNLPHGAPTPAASTAASRTPPDATAAGAGAAPSAGGTSRAAPAVRKLAKDLGVDLGGIVGTGPGGRITHADVARAGGSPRPAGSSRRGIASVLERQASIPQVTTFRTLECTALEAYRRELGLSPLPIVVVALVRTVAEHPAINAGWDDGVVERREVHVGIATDTERGLVVPVLRDAGARGVRDVAAEIARLADAARARTLSPDDLTGATIAVSNTGSYGSEAGTPILSPGTSVTLALGVIEPRALVVDGTVEARPACTLSVTFDHRVLDGAAVGRAVSHLVETLQSPGRLRDLPA